MSVYTIVSQTELEQFLTLYDLGTLISFKGIGEGIENTNYFVSTSCGEFVLTLFEQLKAQELPFFLELMAYLAEHEIPSAHPLADKQGKYLNELNNKPAALVYKLEGASVIIPTVEQCCEIGCALGSFHAISPDFSYYRPNGRGIHWWQQTAQQIINLMPQTDADLLQDELNFQLKHQYFNLPHGVTHADLFRDNALFRGNKLTGILDFYYACNDNLLFDLAVTINAWCATEDGSLETERFNALLEGYQKHRTITTTELQAWPVIIRAAALRFWLSRLADKLFPRAGAITQIKNPEEYKNILQQHRQSPPNLIQ
jgi:homoserine kinase type II